MVKRRINVDKLSDEQLKIAEEKIAERVNGAVQLLTEKWKPELDKYGLATQLEVVVQPGSESDIAEKKHDTFFDNYKDDPKLGDMAEELDEISKGMTVDINSAIKHCNELLLRYGMTCDMAFVSKD